MEIQYFLVYLLFSSILTFYLVHGHIFNPLECFSNNITYSNFKVDFYFSSKNQYYHKLTTKDIEFGNFDFDPKRRTVVTIHGLIPQVYERYRVLLRNAFLEWGDVNLIEVDWREGCTNPLTYVKAVVNTEYAAIKISELFGKLIRSWYAVENSAGTFSSLYIIGHSLGAHVAGQAAVRLKQDHNLTVDRVTGLDPAGPCFHTGGHAHLNLKKSDAKFVDTVHTAGGTNARFRFGKFEAIGHIDFYVNGGKFQPICPKPRVKREMIDLIQLAYHLINENGICQHLQAYPIFAATLKQARKGKCKFWAHSWSASDVRNSKPPDGLKSCNKERCIEMGINAENYKNNSGMYYAPTSGASSFCKY